MSLNHVMIDLETLGTYQGCAILSLGAVAFDAFNVEPMAKPNLYGTSGEHIYIPIELSSCIDAGFKVEGAAFYYWLEQSSLARTALLHNRVSLFEALRAFTDWLKGFEVRWVWSHGAAFDCAMLRSTFYQCRLPDPWPKKCERDTRTVFDIAFGNDVPWPRENPYVHVALYDAWTQAILVKMAFAKIRTLEINEMISGDGVKTLPGEVILDEQGTQVQPDV